MGVTVHTIRRARSSARGGRHTHWSYADIGQRDLQHAALLEELGARGVHIDGARPRERAEPVELRHIEAEACRET